VAKLQVVVALTALIFADCSSGPSAAVRDTRVCAAYETFWDTDYAGPPPSAEMVAATKKLNDAIKHGHDKKLTTAAQAVMDGVLSTPPLRSRATAKQYISSNKFKSVVAAVEPNDRFVESRCDQLGRPING
jgi:hypothetical protein